MELCIPLRGKDDAINSIRNPTMEMWAELAQNDVDFKEEFNKAFNNPDVKEANDGYTADSYDQYVNMELTLD